MNSKQRKRRLTKPEATTGLSAVRSVQGDMRTLQKMLDGIEPHLKVIVGLADRVGNLEQIVGSLATELAELKRRQ